MSACITNTLINAAILYFYIVNVLNNCLSSLSSIF